MVAATQDEIEEYDCQPLSRIKEKPITDLINQLDIADGLKRVLISSAKCIGIRFCHPWY